MGRECARSPPTRADWIALIVLKDPGLGKTIEVRGDVEGLQIITTERVSREPLNFARGKGEYLWWLAGGTTRQFCCDPNVAMIPLATRQFQEALECYTMDLDQSWNQMECASFTIKVHHQLRKALVEGQDLGRSDEGGLLRY